MAAGQELLGGPGLRLGLERDFPAEPGSHNSSTVIVLHLGLLMQG